MSDDKLIHLAEKRKPRVHYRGICKHFTRPQLKREFELVRADELPLLPPITKDVQWYTCRYSGPGEGYFSRRSIPLRSYGVKPELLLYRVLRDLYGPADILTAALPKGAHEGNRGSGSSLPWEWSFMLKGASNNYFEIHKTPGTQDPHVSLWRPQLSDASEDAVKALAQELMHLIRELKVTLKESKHLVDSRDVKSRATSQGPENIYEELLSAGDDQLAAAKFFGDRYSKQVGRETKGKKQFNLGTFHLSAAIYYLLALEAFVNLLIELLRKEEFLHDIFDRATTKADFELRILSLPLYCNGFSSIPFPPNGDIFKSVKRLRTFRNNLLHGNLSRDDHVLYVLPEDHYMFFWWPAADDIDGDKPFEKLPLARSLFRAGHAQAVRGLVEEVVNAVQAAMEPKYRSWVSGWRHHRFAPAVLKDGRWEPNFSARRGLAKKRKPKK